MRMIFDTLRYRLMEKGKDLSVYDINDYNFFFDEQYFSLPEMTCNDNEIFIDCGVFNGITIKDFVEFCRGKHKKIYAFEPIPDQYKNSLQNLQKWGIQRVELIEKGVWSSEATFNFAENGVSSKISDNGTIPIEVVAIDSVIPENENVTFIKFVCDFITVCYFCLKTTNVLEELQGKIDGGWFLF